MTDKEKKALQNIVAALNQMAPDKKDCFLSYTEGMALMARLYTGETRPPDGRRVS